MQRTGEENKLDPKLPFFLSKLSEENNAAKISGWYMKKLFQQTASIDLSRI